VENEGETPCVQMAHNLFSKRKERRRHEQTSGDTVKKVDHFQGSIFEDLIRRHNLICDQQTFVYKEKTTEYTIQHNMREKLKRNNIYLGATMNPQIKWKGGRDRGSILHSHSDQTKTMR